MNNERYILIHREIQTLKQSLKVEKYCLDAWHSFIREYGIKNTNVVKFSQLRSQIEWLLIKLDALDEIVTKTEFLSKKARNPAGTYLSELMDRDFYTQLSSEMRKISSLYRIQYEEFVRLIPSSMQRIESLESLMKVYIPFEKKELETMKDPFAEAWASPVESHRRESIDRELEAKRQSLMEESELSDSLCDSCNDTVFKGRRPYAGLSEQMESSLYSYFQKPATEDEALSDSLFDSCNNAVYTARKSSVSSSEQEKSVLHSYSQEPLTEDGELADSLRDSCNDTVFKIRRSSVSSSEQVESAPYSDSQKPAASTSDNYFIDASDGVYPPKEGISYSTSPQLVQIPQKPTAARPAMVAPQNAAPPEAVSPVSDDVQFRLAAQNALCPGEWAIVKFMMYEGDDFERADREASRMGDDVRQNTSGLHEVQRGTVLRVRLQSDDVQIEDAERTLVWKGRYSSCDFEIFLPEQYKNPLVRLKKRQVRLKARVYEGLAPLTDLSLILSIRGGVSEPAERCRFRSAFLSYSSKDRAQVLSCMRGVKLVRDDMDLFMDVLELRRGEHYEPRLMQEICARDLFYLFWSRSAAESEWVKKELQCALENKNPNSIEPIPLEPPEICPPPEPLKDRHFNDWHMLYHWFLQNMEKIQKAQ